MWKLTSISNLSSEFSVVISRGLQNFARLRVEGQTTWQKTREDEGISSSLGGLQTKGETSALQTDEQTLFLHRQYLNVLVLSIIN